MESEKGKEMEFRSKALGGGGLWEKRNCDWEELSREIPVRIRLSSGVRSCA